MFDEEIFKQEDDVGIDTVMMMRLKKHGFDHINTNIYDPRINELLSNPEVDLDLKHVRDIITGRVDKVADAVKSDNLRPKIQKRKKKSSDVAVVLDSSDSSVRIAKVRLSNNAYLVLRLLSSLRVQTFGKVIMSSMLDSLTEKEKKILSDLDLIDNNV